MLEFFEEYVEPARDDCSYRPACAGADILERMMAAAPGGTGISRPRVDFLPVDLEDKLAVEDVPPFALLNMAVQRRTCEQ
jgi:hypothetical protein